MALGAVARAHGVRLLTLETVDSTNDEARRLIDAGERGPLWIVAHRQTKGRGRLGRSWLSFPGNLVASYIAGDVGSAASAPQLGFAAGVALIRACRATTAQSRRFTLKWPNDLLLDGAKLGGMLLENVSAPTGDARRPQASVATIGIGVNIVEAPTGLPYEARALAALGAGAPSAAEFFAQLSDALVDTLAVWRGGEGFSQIRDEWLSYAQGLGELIEVALARETVGGRFEGLDGAGRLMLATAQGLRAIDAGDVTIGPRQREVCA